MLLDNTGHLSANDIVHIAFSSARHQRDLVARGEVTQHDLFYVAQHQITQHNPTLNAVVHYKNEGASPSFASASHPVQLPYLLKASDEYPGFPKECGSRAFVGTVGQQKHPFMHALDNAGLVPIGMTTMPECGLLASCESTLYGPAKNPWSLDYSALGSSSGAAISVASGMVPFAHASDAAGSIRMPASVCGVVGFKPSAGYSLRARAYDFIDDYLCTDSLLARTVDDVIDATNLTRPQHIAPYHFTHQPLKVAVISEGLGGVKPSEEVAAAMARSRSLLAQIPGITLVDEHYPFNVHALQQALQTLWCYLGGHVTDGVISRLGTDNIEQWLEPWTLGLHAKRATLPTTALIDAYAIIEKARSQMAAFFAKVDVVLSPVVNTTTPKLGDLSPSRHFETLWQSLFDFMGHTPIHNMLGLPSISIPLTTTPEGLPIGTLLSAAFGQDDRVLQLAQQLEQLSPWAQRRPSLNTTTIKE